MASADGPEAIAALIDQRLGALERARSFVEWDRVRTFASDLSMTVQTIVDELGPAEPALAVERLLRFIATHSGVFERIDNSQGRVQDIYETAIDALGLLVTATSESGALTTSRCHYGQARRRDAWLPSNGCFRRRAITSSGSARALGFWARSQTSAPSDRRNAKMSTRHSTRAPSVIACRQAIAEARSDLDGFVALEQIETPQPPKRFRYRREDAREWTDQRGA